MMAPVLERLSILRAAGSIVSGVTTRKLYLFESKFCIYNPNVFIVANASSFVLIIIKYRETIWFLFVKVVRLAVNVCQNVLHLRLYCAVKI